MPRSQDNAAICAAITQALELLGRASGDWQNGTDAVPGPLHWPVAVNLARRELAKALEEHEPPARAVEICHGVQARGALLPADLAFALAWVFSPRR